MSVTSTPNADAFFSETAGQHVHRYLFGSISKNHHDGSVAFCGIWLSHLKTSMAVSMYAAGSPVGNDPE